MPNRPLPASKCANPLCSCEPCGCLDCRCGAAKLGTLERRVMEVVWASTLPELTVRNTWEALPQYAYTTLATVLDRLVSKGVLHSRLVDHTKRYTAVGSRGAHTAVLMHEALASDGDPEAALRRFAGTLNERQREVLAASLLPRVGADT